MEDPVLWQMVTLPSILKKLHWAAVSSEAAAPTEAFSSPEPLIQLATSNETRNMGKIVMK